MFIQMTPSLTNSDRHTIATLCIYYRDMMRICLFFYFKKQAPSEGIVIFVEAKRNKYQRWQHAPKSERCVYQMLSQNIYQNMVENIEDSME